MSYAIVAKQYILSGYLDAQISLTTVRKGSKLSLENAYCRYLIPLEFDGSSIV